MGKQSGVHNAIGKSQNEPHKTRAGTSNMVSSAKGLLRIYGLFGLLISGMVLGVLYANNDPVGPYNLAARTADAADVSTSQRANRSQPVPDPVQPIRPQEQAPDSGTVATSTSNVGAKRCSITDKQTIEARYAQHREQEQRRHKRAMLTLRSTGLITRVFSQDSYHTRMQKEYDRHQTAMDELSAVHTKALVDCD